MISNVVTYSRMFVELLSAIFLAGMLAALAGAAACGIAQLVHF
jgi:hypothetical protein